MENNIERVKQRVKWVDYAKGICIILVVAMHSTLGVEKAAGALSSLHGFIDWARPFRMPDFFLISGLFLASRIDRPWRTYLDTKFIHFAYFYLLWMTIQFLTKGYGIYQDGGVPALAMQYAQGFIEPYGTLWFIYMLAVFFIVVKLVRQIPPVAILAVAAALEILTKTGTIETGHTLIDEFASRFVYFYVGYWMAGRIFNLAERVSAATPLMIGSGLVVWAAFNFLMVHSGLSVLPGISLPLGFIGGGAVISSGVLLSKFKFAEWLRYCGENSIVIYLAFLFMAAARSMLFRLAPDMNLAIIAGLTTLSGVLGPVLLFWATRHTWASFLFKRPAWARLAEPRSEWHSASHVGKPAQTTSP
jgi:uncharacterized membrane protein YcfT